MGLFLLIQVVPYSRNHANPPSRNEPTWDSPTTRQLAVWACYDCHSNETIWPWYSNVAPVSWLVQRDVEQGRDQVNFSEWGRRQEAAEAAETIIDGEMPPFGYTWLHPNARLSNPERNALIEGLQNTFGSKRDQGRRENDDKRERELEDRHRGR